MTCDDGEIDNMIWSQWPDRLIVTIMTIVIEELMIGIVEPGGRRGEIDDDREKEELMTIIEVIIIIDVKWQYNMMTMYY